MRDGATRLGQAAAVLLVLSATVPARAESRFRVTGRSLTEIRLEGGRDRGLKVGDRLRVLSGQTPIGELEVVSVGSRTTSCRVVSVTHPIGVGDVAVPMTKRASLASTPTAPPDAPAEASIPAPDERKSRDARSRGFAAMAPQAAPAASPTQSSSPEPAPTPPPPAPSPGRRFRVRYRSAQSIYLDGGRADGLDVGDRLRVVSGGTALAEIEVVYAAERSASCKVVSEERPVRAGDEAVLVAAGRTAQPEAGTEPTPAPAAPAAPASALVQSPNPSPGAPWARIRASASFGYYRSWDQTESALDYQQRTARLDLLLDQIAGQPLSFTLRARSRQDVRARTLSTRTPADERTDQLYELALRYEPSSDRVAFEVGRIGIYRFVGVGYLDGALARYRPAGAVQVALFGGRVADVAGLGWNGAGSKYGVFVRLAPARRYSTSGYDATLAYVRENAYGDVSREYLSQEGFFGSGGRWSITERAELDLNRGWRQDLTGRSYQLSNVSLAGNLRLAASSWVVVSYDGRRNYRYYQNRVVPEEVFDDLLHQGLRAALTVARTGGFGATVGFGMSLKERDPRHPELDVANAYSFNGGVRHANLFGTGLSFGIDGSGFTNGYADGGLLSTWLGWRATAGHTLGLSYGSSLYRVTETQQDRTTEWLRLLGRGQLTRRLYLLGDLEYDTGNDLKGPRIFLELGVLF
jgi:hypothetical protein